MKIRRQNLKLLPLLLGWLLCLNTAFGQNAVKGVVRNEKNEPLALVNIQVKGTKQITATTADGQFELKLKSKDVLVYSYTGYQTREVSWKGDLSFIILMEPNTSELDEVVVTALGIKKEKKAIGYSIQEVKGEELVKAREPNVINSLAGKVAGLRIATSTNLFGDPGIALRGRGTLMVVDGVPINSDSWNLSADDIESFSVLKGPVASALYGSQGTGGAIQITTKRGSKNKRGYSVEFNSSTQLQTGFNAIPGHQTEYGPGSNFQYSFLDGKGGGVNDADYDIWGPRFEGQLINQWNSKVDPATGALIPLPWLNRGSDNLTNFLQTGILSSNNIAISANNDKGDIRFSITQLYQRGMIPNTQVASTNINMSGGLNISKKLRLETNINYNKQYTPNYPRVAYQPSSPIYTMMVWGASDYDVRELKDYWQPGKIGTQQRNVENYQYSNPWFTVYEQLQAYYKDDIYGYAKLKYTFNPNLDIHFRTNVSSNYLNRNNRFPISTSQYNGDGGYFQKGGYNESFSFFWENNTDVLLTYKQNNILPDISVKASVGGNLRSRKTNYQYSHTNNGLLVPQLWTVQNSVDPSSTETSKSANQVKSAYAYADFDYKKMLYLNVTGRMDQSATLPKQNNSYFYPSISLSGIVSEMIKLPSFISFAKLRASYAKVGADLGLYSLYPTYSTGTRWNGNASLYYDGTLYNPDILPEFNKALEFGADLRFFHNRLGIDVTYFNNIEGPGIFYLPLSSSSGASSLQRNGLTYKRTGTEIILTGTPVKTKNFSWDITINWSTYHRYLKQVYDTLSQINRINIGERTDKLFLTDFQRSTDGQNVYSATTGRALFNNFSSLAGYGDNDWIASLQNTFRYKEFSMSFMLDSRYGGALVNYLSQKQWQAGAHADAANEYRLADWNNRITSGYTGTFIGNGVNVTGGSLIVDGNGNVVSDTRTFKPNTKSVKWESFARGYWGSSIANLVDKSYIKLREVIISYYVPQKLLSKQKLFNAASISLVGRNLWYHAKDKNARNIDLDQWTGTGTDLETPSVKSFGINVNLTF